ncbi:MAG TPA: FHIPEP family type III secretion protein, partial [Casimicrobiaceae bacterium]|nr:FHIPEP family type III secretion protein [Casimicrobiaceae bacterium]
IVGGLAIGVLQHDMSISAAADNYVLLAIGDGLVAQIPALVISTAAGLVVSRVGKGEQTGTQLISQLTAQPQALVIAAVVLGIVGLVPGMPHVAFLLLSAGLGSAARLLLKRKAAPVEAPVATAAPIIAPEQREVTWEDVQPVDVLGLEVGYRLIPLVDTGQDGELLRRVKAIRRKFAQDVGFLPPPVHIRDNLDLAPGAYVVTLKGVPLAQGECRPGMYLAIDPGRATGKLPGIATRDPAFGLPAQWIEAAQRDSAQAFGYTVVDPGSVIATHLSTVVHAQAAALLGRQEVQGLLDQIAKSVPKLVDDVTPKLLPLATVQRVLQNLLDEGVHLRDLRTILETLADHAPRTQDAGELTSAVRVMLGRAITQQVFGNATELAVFTLEPELERVLQQVMTGTNTEGGIEPELATMLARELGRLVQDADSRGEPPVLLVADRLRAPLARLVRRGAPMLKVLAHSEIPEGRTIRVRATVGGRS